MGDADLERARLLSLQHLRPPLKVPGYEQAQFLGRGAFGEVWKAIDSNSGRSVAIKYYGQKGGLDWSHMAREVEKLQYLFSDRYVVQLFDVGWEHLEQGGPRHMKSVPREKVLALWRLLAAGEIDAINSEPWQDGHG